MITEYKDQKIEKLWPYLVHLHAEHPEVFESAEKIKGTVARLWKGLTDKSRCPNCQAKMKIDLYEPDMADALLVIKVAQEVRKRMKDNPGMTFTEANCVHVPTLGTTDAIRHRTTRCSYLNYLKQPKDLRNTGKWLITTWGWQLLRGEPVPMTVRYFRGELIDCPGDKTITLPQMMQVHKDMIKKAADRRKKPRSDHSAEASEYNPTDWVGFGGYVQGEMI